MGSATDAADLSGSSRFMDISLSQHQALFINSWAFFAFSILAIAAYRILMGARSGLYRSVLLALCNLYFLSFFITGLTSIVFLSGLLLFTYGVGTVRRRKEEVIAISIFHFVVIALWVCLFLVKDPDLFPPLNPFHGFPVHLVGISFLMFRAINYIEDAPIFDQTDFLTFVNYMLFFPTLMAGPIERYDGFSAHHDKPVPLTEADCLAALHRIANGFIKKYVIADNLFVWTTFGNVDPSGSSVPMLWIMGLLQLLVLYLDFAGYCDIMIGISRLLGFRIIENFDRPLMATNVQDFWFRWHISLTWFIRDYVFTPLARAAMFRFEERTAFFAITGIYFFTMMLIALWHATTWGFVAFGALHGCVLVLIQLRAKYLPQGTILDQFITTRLGTGALDWSKRTVTYVFTSLSMLFWMYGVAGTADLLSRMFGGGQ